ncbi:hypothetical protein EDB80DRAFT_688547 [Ilyonectria destructans]|nr:hypothetical protein EDB80DRAFT_688547 [Ilyonectria destructans]
MRSTTSSRVPESPLNGLNRPSRQAVRSLRSWILQPRGTDHAKKESRTVAGNSATNPEPGLSWFHLGSILAPASLSQRKKPRQAGWLTPSGLYSYVNPSRASPPIDRTSAMLFNRSATPRRSLRPTLTARFPLINGLASLPVPSSRGCVVFWGWQLVVGVRVASWQQYLPCFPAAGRLEVRKGGHGRRRVVLGSRHELNDSAPAQLPARGS